MTWESWTARQAWMLFGLGIEGFAPIASLWAAVLAQECEVDGQDHDQEARMTCSAPIPYTLLKYVAAQWGFPQHVAAAFAQ